MEYTTPKVINMILTAERLDQKSLASKVGVHPSNLSRFLAGQSELRAHHLEKLLLNLGINLQAMLQQRLMHMMGGSAYETGDVSSLVIKSFSMLSPLEVRTILETMAQKLELKKQSEGNKVASQLRKQAKQSKVTRSAV